MKIVQIILCVVSAIFGGLSLIAAFSQVKGEGKSIPAIAMIAGSLLLLGAVLCNVIRQRIDYIIALLGCIAICAAAIVNGVKSGKLHIQHHIIRIALSLILIAGFIVL